MYRILLIGFTALTLWSACQFAQSTKLSPIASHFTPDAHPDSLLAEAVESGDGPSTPFDTIPNAAFFSAVPMTLLKEVDYIVDSAACVVLARSRFPLTDQADAYWVDVRMSWFQHQSLLVYDKTARAFTQRVTLAEWYGGDGGQVLTGSWLVDIDGDKHLDIVNRYIEHAMIPSGDTAIELNDQSAALWRWRQNRFEPASADTAALIRRYPIKSWFE